MVNQNNHPLISVIIITRNRPKILANCIDHLAKQSHVDHEIIIVDSSDNFQTKEVCETWPGIQYLSIWNGKNNMPAARNLGLSIARGEIVAYIDDDSMVSPNWLENLVLGYTSEKIGGVGGRTLDQLLKVDPNDPRIGHVLSDGTVIQNFSRDGQEPFRVQWLIGCNMSYRRSILNDLGGFDQKYGGNNSYEDVDMATRVRKAGYDLVLVPTAVVEHIFATRDGVLISRDYENPQVRYHTTHNRAYFVTKCLGLNKTYLKYVLKTVIDMLSSNIKRPFSGGWKLLWATSFGFIRGSTDFYFRF